jgi:hypothetical protein
MVGARGAHGSAYRSLVAKPEGKRPLEDIGIDGNTEVYINEIR